MTTGTTGAATMHPRGDHACVPALSAGSIANFANVAAASGNRLTGQFEAKLVDTGGNVTATIVGEGEAIRIPAEGLS